MKIKSFILITILAWILIPQFISITPIVFAQSQAPAQIQEKEYVPLAPIPGTYTTENCTAENCKSDLESYTTGIIYVVIGVASMIAVILVVIGGIRYMTTSSTGAKSVSKEMITNAVIGLILIMASWLILYTINPNLVDFSIDPATPSESNNTNTAASPTLQQAQEQKWYLTFVQKNGRRLVGPLTLEACQQTLQLERHNNTTILSECRQSGSCGVSTGDSNRKYCYEKIDTRNRTVGPMDKASCYQTRIEILKNPNYTNVGNCTHYTGRDEEIKF